MVQAAIDAFGRIDVVVNNAGNLRDSLFHKMTEEEFDSVIGVHLKGAFNVSRAAAPHFKTQASGAYVHMTSTSGLVGNFGQAQLFRRQARHRRPFEIDRARHAALQRALERGRALRLDAHDRLDSDQHARAAEARRGPEEARAGEDRALRDGAGERRRRSCHRADLRRAQQRDLSLLAAAADPHRAYRRTAGRAETIAERVFPMFANDFYPLHRSGDVFTWDPV